MTTINTKDNFFQPLVVTLLPILLLFSSILGFSLSNSSLNTALLYVLTSLSPFVILSLHGLFLIPYQQFCFSTDYLTHVNLSKKSKVILLFLVLTFFLELSVSGNLPLFYYLGIFSSTIDYASYGIKSLHGLFNAMCFLYFMVQLNTSQKHRLFHVLLPIFFFSLAFARGWLFVCFGYYFILKLLSLRSLLIFRSKTYIYISISILILLSCFAFGAIGQHRVFLSINEPFWSTQLPLPFSQALLEWPYIYLVGSTANSLNIVEFAQPTPELLPEWLLSKFMPSASASFLGDLKAPDVYDYENLRIHELVTTASLHADIYIVSGFVGCLVFFTLFWLILSYFQKKSISDNRFLILLPYLILLAYLFPFSNLVLELPFILPFFAMFLLFKRSDFVTTTSP